VAKARTIIGLARGVVSGTLGLDTLAQADDEHAAAALVALSGIGRWSAEYVLLRGLGRLGVLPGAAAGECVASSVHQLGCRSPGVAFPSEPGTPKGRGTGRLPQRSDKPCPSV
jgi:hypothetical protein